MPSEKQLKYWNSLKGKTSWNKGKPAPWAKNNGKNFGIPWNKGTKGVVKAWNKGKKMPEMSGEKHPMWGKHHSELTIDKLKKSHKGKHYSPSSEFKKGMIPWTKGKFGKENPLFGKPRTIITRKKISNAHKGEKSHNWKGGIEPENKRIRKSIEYSLWREVVFARDNWTCQKTGIKGGKLHPHHILNFSQFPELRFAIDNGITLSEKSHREFHKKYGIKNNTREQLEEFLNKKLGGNCL